MTHEETTWLCFIFLRPNVVGAEGTLGDSPGFAMRQFQDTPYSLARMNKPVLLIARHGATGDDDSYNSPENPKLNADGYKESNELADFLKDYNVEKIVSSGLDRSKETSNILGKRLGKKVVIDPDLDSLDVGDVANMTDADEADRVIRHHQDNINDPIPGGESILNFRNRVRPKFLKSIRSFYSTGNPDLLMAHHSVEHEAGEFFNDDKKSSLTRPGGVVAVYMTPNGLKARPIFRPE